MKNQSILYSYRRCPYAIRARMALAYANITWEHREISFKNKPKHMLSISPKGTVPVLLLPDNTVLEESLDIIYWALKQQDSNHWWHNLSAEQKQQTQTLINMNDHAFKKALDNYKYADRHPEFPANHYRQQAEFFLEKLESNLNQFAYLITNQITLADIAIFPFIRQFAKVDYDWFAQSKYQKLKTWLTQLENSELFNNIMDKYPIWEEPQDEVYLNA